MSLSHHFLHTSSSTSSFWQWNINGTEMWGLTFGIKNSSIPQYLIELHIQTSLYLSVVRCFFSGAWDLCAASPYKKGESTFPNLILASGTRPSRPCQACQRKVKRKVKGPFPPLNESGQIKLDHFPKCENKQYLKPPPLKYTGDTVFPMVWTKMRLETIWKPGQKQFLISLTPLSWKISSVKLDSNKKYSQSPTNLAKWNYVSPDIKDFSLLNHHFWGEVLWCSLWGC